MEIKNTEWILKNSVGDPNYAGCLKLLTDEELIYCLKNERRTSGQAKLRAEARRRGLDPDKIPGPEGPQTPERRDEPVSDTAQAAPQGAQQLQIFGEFLPKKEPPKESPKKPAPARTAVVPVTQEPPADRPWLVAYAGHRIEIQDPSGLTLEELRKPLERDFPELSPERVTWHWVPPEEDGQGENGEAQAGESREQKPKEPLILVPVVTAGKKGSGDPVSRALRGYFWSAKEALEDPRPVAVLAARDGRLYEVRKTPVGVFSRALEDVPELDLWAEGFVFGLPRIPATLLEEALFAFRAALPNEAVLQVLWDGAAGAYRLGLPEQRVRPAGVDFARAPLPEGLVWVMDIHSHARLAACFSGTDDRDELATGLYAVVGRVHTPFPELRVRYSCGGSYREIPPCTVFELEEVR